ncbi:hypothetical protein BH09ACT8_BH09ACT8_48300 [soil metagenome]
MTLVVEDSTSASGQANPTATRRRRSRWGPFALFIALTATYFTIGAVLVIRFNMFEWDGVSRVANAGYTIMSRDPHLAAVGFVWNPLPSLVEIPLLALSAWWPDVKVYALAGSLQSAVFMAGSVLIVRQIAIDREVGAGWRWIAIACFALNPMNIVYGGSGMSEAAMMFCLLWSTRYLLLWVDSRRTGHLAWAGIALGVGYLVRYELIPAACGAAAMVGVLAFVWSGHHHRVSSATLNVVIVVFPTAAAFTLWAITGWIVSGDLFATVTSQYGNTAQVETAMARGGITSNADTFVIAERLLGMQPLLGLAVILAVAIWALTKRAALLVPLATFGAVLVFSAWGQYSASTYGLFRYYMPAIPIVLVIALACWTPTQSGTSRLRLGSVPACFGAAVLSLSLVVGLPVTGRSMLDENNSGQQLLLGVRSLFNRQEVPPNQQWYRRAGDDDRRVATYLDNKNLDPGTVLTDTFISAVVWLSSDNPKQFVVTSDFDFTAALNRPWESGVKYILISNPAGNAAQDAITTRYPTMWSDGAGIGKLVLTVDGPSGQDRWRVYEVLEPQDEPEQSSQLPR